MRPWDETALLGIGGEGSLGEVDLYIETRMNRMLELPQDRDGTCTEKNGRVCVKLILINVKFYLLFACTSYCFQTPSGYIMRCGDTLGM